MANSRNSNRGSRSRRGRYGGRRRYSRRPRVCRFCAEKIKEFNYKQVDTLKRFVDEQGKIRPRRDTGTCARHQRLVARVVKRARHMALLSYAAERYP